MRATFSGFSIAKQGLDVARANLQVTGQNMTNAGSIGYTRQRVDAYARGVGSYGMRYAAPNDAYIGEGVQMKGVSQLRDPYLDVRYRKEHAKAGSTVAQYDALADLGTIFDSATEEGFDTQMSDLITQLQQLAGNPSDPVRNSIVKTSATTLLQIFNECAQQLKTIRGQQLEGLQNDSILSANKCLESISALNEEIKSAQVSGNPALELLDERNLLLDELSQYANIEIVTTQVNVGGGVMVDELSVNLLAPNGEKFMLVDNGDYRKFDLVKNADGDPTWPVQIQLLEKNGKPVDSSQSGAVSLEDGVLNGQLTTGIFQGTLKMLNSEGEFGDPPSTVRGFPYYQGMIDNLASTFAKVMNDANSPDGVTQKPLFASKDGGPITAENIVISEEWKSATSGYITDVRIQSDGTEKKDNILYMVSLFSAKNDFKTDTGYPLFSGTFQENVTHIVETQGLEMQSVTRQNKTNISNLTNIDTQRQSISAVNVDEEGINLIMFNQALTAASRYMTTLDEAVETIISRMGIVGR